MAGLENESKPVATIVEAIALTFSALGAAGLAGSFRERWTWDEVARELEVMRDPAKMTAELEDPELRKQAMDEWQEVLDLPYLSPVPMLEALLEDESWESIDVSVTGIIDA